MDLGGAYTAAADEVVLEFDVQCRVKALDHDAKVRTRPLACTPPRAIDPSSALNSAAQHAPAG
jgi:hypothetical protein